ncbi:hypothetical protein U128_03435 [Anaplasma marginale str. Gypsy Plains]|nr:hypothetical protein U128_03435 [Anaplasma marginale str. Gypsy Plains]
MLSGHLRLSNSEHLLKPKKDLADAAQVLKQAAEKLNSLGKMPATSTPGTDLIGVVATAVANFTAAMQQQPTATSTQHRFDRCCCGGCYTKYCSWGVVLNGRGGGILLSSSFVNFVLQRYTSV